MAKVERKQFPIQATDGYPAGWIPWVIAEQAYEEYSKKHRSQSLERLASRGGFGWFELIHLLRNRSPYSLSDEERNVTYG